MAGNPAKVVKVRDEEKYRNLDEQKKYYLKEKKENSKFRHIFLRKS